MTAPDGPAAPRTLAELIDALTALAALPAADRLRLAPRIADWARAVAPVERGRAVEEERAAGRTIVAMARQLGINRSKLDDAAAAWRRHAATGGVEAKR